jgi:all-trans-retinol 13,14-reductase
MKHLFYLILGCLFIIACIIVFFPSRIPSTFHSIGLNATPSWTVSLPSSRPQALNTYDAIIIGGGFGGLSCGALLAKEGYHVLVLEKNDQVGGYGSNDALSGYTFSYGAQDISGVWERGSITYLLRCLNMDEQKLLVRNNRRFILNGESIDIPAVDNGFEKVFSERFPRQIEAIHTFFTDAKRVYLEVFDKDVTKEWGIPLSKTLMSKTMPKEWLKGYEESHHLMSEWQKKTYREVLDEYFQQEDIKTLLCSVLGYIGARASKNSAFSVVVASGYFFFGGYHILGGSQHLADSLAKYISDHKGAVLYQHPVDAILVKHGAVQGVRVGNTVFNATVVVSNVNAKTLYLDLVSDTDLPSQFLHDIEALPMGGSSFLVFLGATEDFPSYPSIINDIDHRVHVIVNSQDDPSTAPLGYSSVTIEQNTQMKDFPAPLSLDYDLRVTALMDEMIEKATLSLPGLKDHIVCKKAVTPRKLQELTAIPQGAIYCFDQSHVATRPHFKSPIAGLYLANASSSGGGVEAVVIGGITCKHDITGWQRKNP